MSQKYVSQTAAGRSISAYVVLNKKGEHVATVQAFFGQGINGNTVLVNVFDTRCMSADWKDMQVGRSTCSGIEAALDGLVIDGHTLYDHSRRNDETAKLLKAYHADKTRVEPKYDLPDWDRSAAKIGAKFSNWTRGSEPLCRSQYNSLHMVAGLDRLVFMGYTVISAI